MDLTAFNGRWDISVPSQPSRAWWLEVSGAGTPQAAGLFVGAPGGQLDPIQDLVVADGQLSFSFWRKYRGRDEDPERGYWSARLEGGRLAGECRRPGTDPFAWVGVRAPEISEQDDGSWREGAPIALFNGKDLSGWQAMHAGRDLGWEVKDGLLQNRAGANNLVSEAKFWNFRLQVEYRLGEHSNSGIGLRGRYEVQIYEDHGQPPSKHSNGSIYSRYAPSVNASRRAGEWQSFDIRLVGRTVTVVLNGQTVIDRKVIEGLTAIAHDSKEGEPGPISLQGDHGPVAFRKLVLTPLLK